jgi:hypothetical protein
MGLRPTQGMKMAFVQQPLFMEAPPSPLSSRAQSRDLQFRGPFLEMSFDRAHPDFLPRGTNNGPACGFLRGAACSSLTPTTLTGNPGVAKWRDLRFSPAQAKGD